MNQRSVSVIAALSVLLAFLAYPATADIDPATLIDVDGQGAVHFGYQVLPGAKDIELELRLKGSGWVGLGFGPNGMNNANTYMTRYDATSKTGIVVDGWAAGWGLPDTNDLQIATVVAASYTGDVTTIRFKRSIAGPGDSTHKAITLGEPNGMIFAWNPTRNKFGYHGEDNHAQFKVKFVDNSARLSAAGGKASPTPLAATKTATKAATTVPTKIPTTSPTKTATTAPTKTVTSAPTKIATTAPTKTSIKVPTKK